MHSHKKMHLHFVVKMQVMILSVIYLYQLSTKNYFAITKFKQ